MNRALGSLGLAMRAGRVQSGEENCLKLVKAGASFLLLIDAGASAASKKTATDACAHYNVPYRLIPAGDLGQAIGKSGRMVAAITDRTFAERLAALLEDAAKQSID